MYVVNTNGNGISLGASYIYIYIHVYIDVPSTDGNQCRLPVSRYSNDFFPRHSFVNFCCLFFVGFFFGSTFPGLVRDKIEGARRS